MLFYIFQKPKSLVVWVGETCVVTWKIRRVLLVDRQTGKIVP